MPNGGALWSVPELKNFNDMKRVLKPLEKNVEMCVVRKKQLLKLAWWHKINIFGATFS